MTVKANHNFELLKRTLNFCSFMKAGKQNFITNVFINHILSVVNPDLLKCPIKKGSYMAAGPRLKQTNEMMTLPPFVQTGQEVNFLVIFKSIINKKSELVCSVTLDLTVVWVDNKMVHFKRKLLSFYGQQFLCHFVCAYSHEKNWKILKVPT